MLKSLSPQQLEDFRNRWDEVFRDRIEEIENHFCVHSDSSCKTHETTSFSQLKSLPKFNWDKNPQQNPEKFKLFSDILSIEKLAEVKKIDPKVTDIELSNHELKQNGNFDSEIDCDTKIVNVEFTLSDADVKKLDGDTDSSTPAHSISQFNLMCRVSPNFFFHEFNYKDAAKILLTRLKCLLRTKRKSIKKLRSYATNRRNKDTVSCHNQFSFQSDIDSEGGTDAKTKSGAVSINYSGSTGMLLSIFIIKPLVYCLQFGKNWIEKQLKNSLDRAVFDAVNYKVVVLSILDFMTSELPNQELEMKVT